VNGADEEEKPKKAAPPKKAPAAEKKAPAKKVSTAPASAKKRAQKKVSFLFLSYLSSVPHTLQDAEESGEDFADEIDDVPAEEDEPPEADNKKRKVCLTIFGYGFDIPFSSCIGDQRPAPKAVATKPTSKKAKPASGRAKKVKATDEEAED
jgi:hypothetical protein